MNSGLMIVSFLKLKHQHISANLARVIFMKLGKTVFTYFSLILKVRRVSFGKLCPLSWG